MAKLPTSPCNWSAYPNAMHRIYERLGVKGNKLPKTMHGEFNIDGWQIVVKRGGPGTARSGKPRIFVRADGRLVPAGRVRQALCRVNIHHARRRAARHRGARGRFS